MSSSNERGAAGPATTGEAAADEASGGVGGNYLTAALGLHSPEAVDAFLAGPDFREARFGWFLSFVVRFRMIPPFRHPPSLLARPDFWFLSSSGFG